MRTPDQCSYVVMEMFNVRTLNLRLSDVMMKLLTYTSSQPAYLHKALNSNVCRLLSIGEIFTGKLFPFNTRFSVRKILLFIMNIGKAINSMVCVLYSCHL